MDLAGYALFLASLEVDDKDDNDGQDNGDGTDDDYNGYNLLAVVSVTLCSIIFVPRVEVLCRWVEAGGVGSNQANLCDCSIRLLTIEAEPELVFLKNDVVSVC